MEKPKYNSQNRQKRKLTPEIVDEIKLHLRENKLKRSRGQAKQQNKREGTNRKLTQTIYYGGFKFRFCNIRSGNEKSHVERSVEYIRRKSLAFKDNFNSIEEANEYLLEVCQKLNNKPQRLNNNQTALEIFNLEKKHLLPKMPMFDAAKTRDSRVDKYSTIVVDMCQYAGRCPHHHKD